MFGAYFSQYLPFWFDTFFGVNTFGDVISAVILFLVAYFGLYLLRIAVLSRLSGLFKKTKTDIDDRLFDAVSSIRPSFYLFVAFFVGLQVITFEGIFGKIIDGVMIAVLSVQTVLVSQHLVDYFIHKRVEKSKNGDGAFVSSAMMQFSRFALWVVAVLFVLSNLGVNITSLIAGLGIGGIAVALAAQNLLSDLLSYFSIYFDKPFKTGEFIIIGQQMGTVERVGIMTTRVRSLFGEEIVVPNKELVNIRIQNYGRMYERRVVFTFGVEYGTSVEQLKKINEVAKETIVSIEKTRFDRSHFVRFGDSSLDFEVVYYLTDPDYNLYMDVQQRVLFALKQKVEEMGVSFAFPTRTVRVVKE